MLINKKWGKELSAKRNTPLSYQTLNYRQDEMVYSILDDLLGLDAYKTQYFMDLIKQESTDEEIIALGLMVEKQKALRGL